MAKHWRVLALLFLIRTVMAFQFGSVGALGPLVGIGMLALFERVARRATA